MNSWICKPCKEKRHNFCQMDDCKCKECVQINYELTKGSLKNVYKRITGVNI